MEKNHPHFELANGDGSETIESLGSSPAFIGLTETKVLVQNPNSLIVGAWLF